MAVAVGDPFDAHVFACNIALSHVLDRQAPGHGLGLSGPAFKRLLDVFFPGSGVFVDPSSGAGEDAIEEADLRALLLSGRAKGTMGEEWLAAILARACQRPNHLWQDLGLRNRSELSRLMTRHFPGLAALNQRDMKWKKFFYRQLCEAENVPICKSPVCDACADFAHCFGSEEANPLLALR
ncbi:MAG: nitrogen fixation protein NifQ [Rhodospirillales bacterium]|nr:MAG: nitrogen fixation protein NifQ [Rhodospirillales bacterium]